MAYPIGRCTWMPLSRMYIEKVTGLENVPLNKPFIIASNQQSAIDGLFILATLFRRLKKKIHFLANLTPSVEKRGKLWYNLFLLFLRDSFFVKWSGCIPIDEADKGKRALQEAAALLKKGEIVGIFPEGRRSIDGKLLQGKTGVARILLQARVPVVPIGLLGTNKVFPLHSAFPRFKRASIRIGKPLHFNSYYSKKITKSLLRKITTVIMQEIAKLSKQEYTS